MRKIFSLSGLMLAVDLAALACLIALAVSGFALEDMLDKAETAGGAEAGEWLEIHESLFFGFAGLIAAHLLLHGKAFIRRVKSLFCRV